MGEKDEQIVAFLKDFSKIYEGTPKCYEQLHNFLSKEFLCALEEEVRNCTEVKMSLRSRDKLQYELEDCQSGQQGAQHKLERPWEIDSVSKARAEYDTKTLQTKSEELIAKKAVADATIKQELLRWNQLK